MNKSITQATQNDKQISNSIKKFFTRFHVSSALKASNAYKKKGVPVMEIFQYLFLLIFSNRSMYMNLQMFRTMLSDNTELSDEKINELANAFMNALPTMMKIRLQVA